MNGLLKGFFHFFNTNGNLNIHKCETKRHSCVNYPKAIYMWIEKLSHKHSPSQ